MSKMFRKRAIVTTASALSFAAVLALPSVAQAQEKKDCEPGSWFCGDTQPPAKGGDKDLQPLPGDAKPADKSSSPPPPVVVYQPPPPTVVVQAREAPPAYYYVPRKAPPKKEWGVDVHLGGAMLGKGRDDNAGMGLFGLGLRFRPIPQAALQADLDFAGGRDYNGYRRTETAFTLNGLVFLNPKSRAQIYLLGGFGWAGARAVDDRSGFDKTEYHYGYFGVQAGAGLEFRVSRVVALHADLRGLIRGRIDDSKRLNPEFTDGNGRSTNTSGAGLITGGLTFYW